MSEHDTNNPVHGQGGEQRPLGLAESDHGVSSAGAPSESAPAPGDTAAAREASRKRREARAASEKSATAGSSSSGSDAQGKSTSFETLLGRMVVERGLASEEEIDLCRVIQRQSGGEGDPRALTDILIENEYLTRKQIDRFRREFDDDKTSQQIPGYKIIKKLGAGAMATVFLAKQVSLDRLVAIKVLPTKFSSNEKFIERFYKEGRAAAQLNHRNIVAAYDVGQAGEHHYFVMEYVDGETVYDRVKAQKRYVEKEAVEIVLQVARALEHAHAKGFIHRDIKPKNIMLSKDGQVKLADLGLARAVSDKEAAEAEAGRAYGTPYYISPEQIRGEVNIGPPADIYGLGATFYHMVTGKVPFDGKNPSAVMHKHLKNQLVPPDHLNAKLSPGTAQVIEMMMAKSRKDRYRTTADLITDLELIRKGDNPHFARGQMVNENAAKLEEQAPVGPIAVHHSPRVSSGAGVPMNNPVFMTVAAVAVISVLINIIGLGVLISSGGGGGSGGGAGQSSGTGSTTITPTLIGAWTSVNLRGQRFAAFDQLQISFANESQGTLVTAARGNVTSYAFTYTRSGNALTMVIDGNSIRYTYTFNGPNGLTMTRSDGTATMELARD